jgi:hypothetical protein
VPVLIVEAGKDDRVPVDSSVAAIQAALREAGNPDYTMVVFPNAPHTLVERPKAGEPFRWPQITPGYADLLVSWVFVSRIRKTVIRFFLPSRRALGSIPLGIAVIFRQCWFWTTIISCCSSREVIDIIAPRL